MKLVQKLLLDYFDKNKGLLSLYVVVILFTFPVESVVLSRMYSRLFEQVRKKATPLDWHIFRDVKQKLLNLLDIKKGKSGETLVYIFMIWLLVITGYAIKNTMQSYIFPAYLSHLRKIMIERTIENHIDNYQDMAIGKHITRILDFSRTAKDCVSFVLDTLLPLILGIIFINGYFYYVDWHLGLILTIGLVVSFVILMVLGPQCIAMSLFRELYYLRMSENIHDSFSNLMNVYLNNENKSEISKHKDVNDHHTQIMISQMHLARNLIAFLSLISILTFAIVTITAYTKLQSKKLSVQVFVSLFIILIYYLGACMRASDDLPYFLLRIGILKSSYPFLNQVLSDKYVGHMKDVIQKGDIKFQHVTFRYPRSKKILLKDISLHIKGGEKVAITGKSGSGKTTLMKLLLRMYPIQKGDITIDGSSIYQMNIHYLRKNVIYNNQKTVLFEDTVMKNILYGNSGVSPEEVNRLVYKYQLHTVYDGLAKGLQADAGVGGANLSVGMQKITILLRGILKEGKIIIFDEPLAGLDEVTKKNIIKMIREKCKNKTVIIITHNEDIIPEMDRVIKFQDIVKKKTNLQGGGGGGFWEKMLSWF